MIAKDQHQGSERQLTPPPQDSRPRFDLLLENYLLDLRQEAGLSKSVRVLTWASSLGPLARLARVRISNAPETLTFGRVTWD